MILRRTTQGAASPRSNGASKKISDLTPEKWLIRKRLEVAYAKMKEDGKKEADVCAEVGFKNPLHFSAAFKKQYGTLPTAAFV